MYTERRRAADLRILADRLQRERRQALTATLMEYRDNRSGLDRRNPDRRLRDNHDVGSWMRAFDHVRLGI